MPPRLFNSAQMSEAFEGCGCGLVERRCSAPVTNDQIIGLVAVPDGGSVPKQYVVRQESEDNWVIDFDVVSIGPFATEATAIQAAIKAAFASGKRDPVGSGVSVLQKDDKLRVVWTYGTDPPPA